MKRILLIIVLIFTISCTKETTTEEETEPEAICECLRTNYLRVVSGGQPPTITDTKLTEALVPCQEEVEEEFYGELIGCCSANWFKIECTP